ncbi:pilus assembly PilX family protein [Stutzerimonas stutzeri]|uniref:pilus assembly PilX family protein n=1 Tax=Stutzerimonas stutzeri TaxID=316 RepID=UPI00210D78BE|nr:PilX N-terminal domain-containing pilus assembly protein [Stutzerimonas stutzeri]MCQ4322066.1 PilX N-terminal domain-containing pilus assembly protein [Stutzerimonas stutzeri]
MTRKKSLQPEREKGAVLIVALVMLLLLTIIGAASMRDTNLQEKMAGNFRDQNIAFQAAEATLRYAEGELHGLSSAKYNKLYDLRDYEAYKDKEVFENFSADVSEQPTYTITRLPGYISNGGSLETGSGATGFLVRIESIGYGISPNSKVTLRTIHLVSKL